jgi:hypothetical protein
MWVADFILDLLDTLLAELQSLNNTSNYTRNLTVLQFAYSLVYKLKSFTINHNTQSHWNTLCTVLILHWVIPCILPCALLAASLIHLLTELARLSN